MKEGCGHIAVTNPTIWNYCPMCGERANKSNDYNIIWRGIGVTDNRRFIPHTNFKLKPEYIAFKESLAWTIRSEIREQFNKINIEIRYRMSNHPDHQNYLKAICDSIELAGVLKRDKYIGKITMYDPERYNGKELTIWLTITERVEE